MPDQPLPPKEEPKPLSAQLRAVREEYNELAKRSQAAAAKLDPLIWEIEAKERRAEHDKTLDEFVPRNYELLKGHDINLLIAKSKGMGNGYKSPIGAALDFALNLAVALGGHDTSLSTSLWDTSAKSIRLDSDRMDKAREKTESTVLNFTPVAKEIMVSNTPDRQGERKKHYIVVSDGMLSDNPEHAQQMIETAMQLNPNITFDFVSFGSGPLNDLASRIKAPTEAQKVVLHNVATPEEFRGVMMRLLADRFGGQAAPKVEAPKAEAAAAPAEPPAPAPAPAAQKQEAPKPATP
jgi:hypothetical protein